MVAGERADGRLDSPRDLARLRGVATSPLSLQLISSIDRTRSIGVTDPTASTIRSCMVTYSRCRATTQTMPGHILFASHTGVPVFTPYFFAS